MSKCILPDELYKDYKDSGECVGKMYDPNVPNCKNCKDKENCQAAQNADTVIKASQADPAQVYDDSDGFDMESAVEFIQQSGQDVGVEFEKVSMKTREKLFHNDTQVFVITHKHLKCLLSNSGGDYRLNSDEWEEKGKGFAVELENETAVRTVISGVLEQLQESPAKEDIDVSGSEEVGKHEKRHSVPKEEEETHDTSESDVDSMEVEETVEKEKPISVDSGNLDAGFGVYFGDNGLAKVEIYIKRDKLDENVLLEKIAGFISSFKG